MPQVHDAGYERSAYVDPLAWGVPELTAMVRSFTRLTGASTVPSLQEWPILPDKVRPDQQTPSCKQLSRAAIRALWCLGASLAMSSMALYDTIRHGTEHPEAWHGMESHSSYCLLPAEDFAQNVSGIL